MSSRAAERERCGCPQHPDIELPTAGTPEKELMSHLNGRVYEEPLTLTCVEDRAARENAQPIAHMVKHCWGSGWEAYTGRSPSRRSMPSVFFRETNQYLSSTLQNRLSTAPFLV
jgi:hypothetical protein